MKLAKRFLIISLALFFVLDSRFLCACQLLNAEDQSDSGAPCQQVAGCHCEQDDDDSQSNEEHEETPCRLLEPAILASTLLDSHDLTWDLESTISVTIWSTDCPLMMPLPSQFGFHADSSHHYQPRPTYVLFGSFRS